MKGACPNCEKETELDFVETTEAINVRGEEITVHVDYLKCKDCGTEFRDPNSTNDPLDSAYREYRTRHDMLQPESIKELRTKYNLTQYEMSNLLGWGGATLSRYENGALQDEAHETILKLIQEPWNLLELIEQRPQALEKEKKELIIARIKEISHARERSFANIYEDIFGTYEPGEFSGYKRLELPKLFNSMIFFCKDTEVPKTKLNKLVFYADFKHFKEYTNSITGAKYAHLPFGPAPDNYQLYLAALLDDEKSIASTEISFGDYTGEFLQAIKEPILSIFSTTELKILAQVKEYFAGSTAKEISDLSHQEKGYQETRNGQLISYVYAQYLGI